ncbi:MAG: segregation and condensation protein A [marine bacterium B5-7]|nr:MAG: segregation and condensation protein A [marine bacterium B5-7]
MSKPEEPGNVPSVDDANDSSVDESQNPAIEDDSGVELNRAVMVRGEAFEKWPQDLFIPPDALEVILESFQGPLDLLLYLIRRNNLDILDIPVAEITRQYVVYVEVMRRIRLDLAAEYLLMAALLAEIKSRMLIPRSPSGEEEEEEDPRAALVRRLQEYERFREAAIHLEDRPREERDLFVVRARFDDESPPIPEIPVTVEQLVSAYRQAMLNARRTQHLIVGRETLSLRERMTQILDKLGSRRHMRLEDLFTHEEGRMGLVVSFVAVLELSRDHMLRVVQNEPFAPIHIQAISE